MINVFLFNSNCFELFLNIFFKNETNLLVLFVFYLKRYVSYLVQNQNVQKCHFAIIMKPNFFY